MDVKSDISSYWLSTIWIGQSKEVRHSMIDGVYGTGVRIQQPTFFVFFYKICKLECNTTSDWLNHAV